MGAMRLGSLGKTDPRPRDCFVDHLADVWPVLRDPRCGACVKLINDHSDEHIVLYLHMRHLK